EAAPGFEPTIRDIFQARCSMCHTGAPLPDWTNYSTASSNGDNIVFRITLPDGHPQQMPPGNSTGLTDDERELIVAWVDAGAPRNAVAPTGSGGGDIPTGVDEPVDVEPEEPVSPEPVAPTPEPEAP